MRTSIILIALASLSGCASLDIQRKVYDESGRELATINVRHPAATSEGAVRILESARRLEETKQGDDADRRISDIAKSSVDKGQPTSVTTDGGQVQSGYVGYGQYGYDPYGNGQYGYGGPTVHYPGVDPRMVQIEEMWRRGMYRTLPPLGEPVVPFPASGIPPTPGVNSTPGVEDLQQDVNELIRAHRPKKRK